MKSSSIVRFASVGSIAIAALALALSCSLFASPAYAVTAAEKEAEAQAALNELNAMQETLTQASNRYFEALGEYAAAVEKRDAAQARIDEITAEIEDIQDRLGGRAREMYRSGNTSFIDLLFGSATWDELAQNWDLLNRLNDSDAQLSAQAKALRDEQREAKAQFDEQAKIAQQKSDEAQAAYDEATALVEQMEATYNNLSAEAMELYMQEQAAMQAQYATGGVQNDDGTVTDIATGQVYSSPAEYNAVTGNAIVDRAYSMIGHAYRYGSSGYDGAFDCSGLVGYAVTGSFERIGNTTTFMGYQQVSDPQPGDICVNEGHTGIYVGNGRMVHAADYGIGVVEGDVQSGMIYVRYNG